MAHLRFHGESRQLYKDGVFLLGRNVDVDHGILYDDGVSRVHAAIRPFIQDGAIEYLLLNISRKKHVIFDYSGELETIRNGGILEESEMKSHMEAAEQVYQGSLNPVFGLNLSFDSDRRIFELRRFLMTQDLDLMLEQGKILRQGERFMLKGHNPHVFLFERDPSDENPEAYYEFLQY